MSSTRKAYHYRLCASDERAHALGYFKVMRHRSGGGPIKTVTVKRVGPRRYVVVTCEVAVVHCPPRARPSVLTWAW